MLIKLEDVGLGSSFVNLIENYLSDRVQVTKVGQSISTTAAVTCGVPQGSILGPLLFIIYINSLPDVMPNTIRTFLYADDTALVAHGKTADEVSLALNTAINRAATWFNNHRLSLNVKKTKLMLIGTTNKVSTEMSIPPVYYNNEKVEEVSVFKYLGIMLDRNLTFDQHVKYLKRKVLIKMKTLARIRDSISQGLALYLYKSLIVPDFDYADQVYDAMSNQNAEALQIMQNKCLRICTKSDQRCNVAELHKVSGMLFLSDRRKNHCCNTVYRGLNNESSAGLNRMFSVARNESDRSMRSADNMVLTVAPTRLRKTSGNLRTRGAKYYNELPLNVKQAKSYDSFKRATKLRSAVT